MAEPNNEEELKRDQTTHDFVTGLKEREELKAKLHEKERECNVLKGQIYDANKRADDLEKQLAEKNKETKKRRPSSARKPKRPAQRKNDKSKGAKDAALLTPDTNHKDANDNPFEDPEKLYQEIATRFPDIPLSMVLMAEKKFVEADLDRNGTIDADELEKMLDATATSGGSSTMFTKSEIKDILRKIDMDNTNSIDFFECIGVLDLVRQNRKTDLPPSLQQNKSAVCSIQ